MRIEEDYATVPGGRVFVRRWLPAGEAARTPIILLHDSLGCVELWREFPADLARTLQRPVLAYDRLGFGRSTPRRELPTAGFIVEEAQLHFPAIRRALGIDRHLLFGHSVGGAMALTIAAEQDSGCEAVITEAAQAFVEPRTLAGIREARELFRDPEQFARIARRHGERARWVLDAWTEAWLSPAFAGWSLDAYLVRVTCPVLAIHGDQDEYGSVAFPERIVGTVRGPARMEILPECGHVPHREQSQRVLQLVAEFLTD